MGTVTVVNDIEPSTYDIAAISLRQVTGQELERKYIKDSHKGDSVVFQGIWGGWWYDVWSIDSKFKDVGVCRHVFQTGKVVVCLSEMLGNLLPVSSPPMHIKEEPFHVDVVNSVLSLSEGAINTALSKLNHPEGKIGDTPEAKKMLLAKFNKKIDGYVKECVQIWIKMATDVMNAKASEFVAEEAGLGK